MNKINFNFNEHKDKKEAIHCKSHNEAEQWCRYMHDNGLKWCNDFSYLKDNHWCRYEEDTCYVFNEGRYSSLKWYIKRGYTIIEFSSLINSKRVKL